MNEKVTPPDSIRLVLTKKNEVSVCTKCNGIGSFETEELIDYHKRDYKTFRKTCVNCNGDGRVVSLITSYKFEHEAAAYPKTIPYKDAIAQGIEPHLDERYVFSYKINKTDHVLNRKYPELAAVSYDVYDDLVEKYRVIEILKE